jgi:NTE family protein
MLRERHELHRRIRALAALVPPARRAHPQVQQMLNASTDAAITVVHLIHRHKGSETQTRDYEFSRASMLEHWQAGHADMAHSLRSLAAASTRPARGEFLVFDYTQPARRADHEGASS